MATEKMFRDLALSLPETEESAHMQHPDFRVRGKIFATLPKKGVGMVKLTPFEQEVLMRAEPDTFSPAAGAWGRSGCTLVKLSAVKKSQLKDAIGAAYKNVAK